jgi:diguanylate cyclase (GGDEF)-like protein
VGVKHQWLPRARLLLLGTGLYVGAAKLGFALLLVHGTAAAVWPPAGVALALVVLGGTRLWPAVLVGDLIAHWIHGSSFGVSLAFGCGSVLEVLVAAELLRRADFDPRLERVRDVFALLGLAAMLSATIGATVGVLTMFVHGDAHSSHFWSAWRGWWLANAVGDVIVAPVAFVFARGVGEDFRQRTRLETGAFLLMLAALAVGANRLAPGLLYLAMPVITWAALRYRQHGATLANLVACGAGLAGVMAGAGTQLARISLTQRLLFTQDYVIGAAITALVLAATLTERIRAGAELVRSESAAKDLADEQAALRRVATLVASGAAPEHLFAFVAESLCRLMAAAAGLVIRFDGPQEAVTVGAWATARDLVPEPGERFPLEEMSATAIVLRTGRPARVPAGAPATFRPQAGERVAAPIELGGRVWGCVSVAGNPELAAGSEARIERFADLLALAIDNAHARARLVAQATTDPLTGIANHRAFHERLATELARARRYRRPLAIVVFDVDRFKAINDSGGHESGDRVLAEVALRIVGASRSDALVARLGGDELVALLPECDSATAYIVAERARRAVSAAPIGDFDQITLSAGICDTAHAGTADELLRLADGALYWAKAHGRNVCFRYSPEVVRELSATERAQRMMRSQALAGVRALARAVDAKDPATTQHSERVAAIAVALAAARGWPRPRIELLRDAAMVHDVGKIGVPDAILSSPHELTPAEYEQVKRHAALGAQIAADVLHDEQVKWVRWHHERPDGRGYPDGLTADQLPEGAALLALADAWDVMTSTRSYSPPKPEHEALAECRALIGSQFTDYAVHALATVMATRGVAGAAVAAK